MTSRTLDAVVSEIADLLQKCGHEERASWLHERALQLEAAESNPAVRAAIKRELHGVVPGMGGLIDIVPAPEPGSAFSSMSARARLDELAEDLYRLTQ